MEMLITLLPIIFRAINIAPRTATGDLHRTPTVKAVKEDNAGNLCLCWSRSASRCFPASRMKLGAGRGGLTMFRSVHGEMGPGLALNVLHIAAPGSRCRRRVRSAGPLDAARNFQERTEWLVDGWAGDKTQREASAGGGRALSDCESALGVALA